MRKHWQRFYEWWTLTRVLGALALLIGFVSLVVNLPVPPFLSEIAPELVGIGVTVLLIDSANERRAIANERRAEQQRKEELILQMGSPSNDFALEAARIFDHKGWLRDGSLNGAYLWGANLQRADLRRANLQGANLFNAKLQGATLNSANLTGVDLRRANLQGTYIRQVNLQGAYLRLANLEAADLIGANLQKANLDAANLQDVYLVGANLRGANLKDANLQGVKFEGVFGTAPLTCDETTTLPDGSHWTPDRDWREFIHPEEWASEQSKETLLLRLRATYYSVSVKAILSTLRRHGWLFDGTLNHLDLRGVNFTGKDLSGAGLKGARLNGANLQEAHLERANMQGASLRGANLQGAKLTEANLQGADLKNTILPDGSHWTPDRDMREFTHPEEWAAEQAAKNRFTFSKPPGFARGESPSPQ